MGNAFVFIEILFLAIIACFTLTFAISSIWEGEKRATLIGGLISSALLGIIIGLFAFKTAGFFKTTSGLLLILAALVMTAGAFVLFIKRTARNSRALEGTKEYIVGEVKRFDERDQVFARNRSL